MTYALHEHIRADAPCKLCGGHDLRVIATRGRHYQALTTTICTGCGLIHSYPIPAKETLDEYYAHQYRSDYKGTITPKRKHILRYSRVALRRVALLRRFTSAGQALLDVGSGSGEFAYMAALAGFDAHGLEPHAGYSAYTRETFGIDVITAPLERAEIAAGSYDVITINHVLEHLHYPLTSLGYLNRWLKVGGLLAIEVPDIEATRHAPLNRFHRAHIYNFNHHTLVALLDKAGFDLAPQGIVAGTTLFARKSRAPEPERLIPMPDNYQRLMALLAHAPAHAWRREGGTAGRLLRRYRRYLLEFTLAAWLRDPRRIVEREFALGQAGPIL